MKILVINMSSAVERMAFMSTQLQGLGLVFQRLEAVAAADLSDTTDAAYWDSWERPMKQTEKACLLSHKAAWEQVVQDDQPVLILEDDAVLADQLPAVLEALETREGIDHLTLEARGRRKLLAKDKQDILPGLALRRLYQDRSGAAAYVLWPNGAKHLLRDIETCAGLADAVICRGYVMNSFQIEPACALQLDRCVAHGVQPPIAPVSSIDAENRSVQKRTLKFKLRRVAAQLRMGLRALCVARRADRREVAVTARNFER